jgi:ubiquitin-conjugating enzyme E2 N
MSTSLVPKRIRKETEKLAAANLAGIQIRPVPGNPRHFSGFIKGPEGTCFEDGLFEVELFLTKDYPMVAPKVRFITRIYHPNIDRIGRVCLDILKDKWTPALQLQKVALSIQALLQSPNPDDPLDNNIAQYWKDNLEGAQQKAREWAKRYRAKGFPPSAAQEAKSASQ